jgi:pimeloyl-ACP methyl ester carboxylesterase
MKPRYWAGIMIVPAVLACSAAYLSAQSFAPPASKRPDVAVGKAITDKADELSKLITALGRQGVRDPLLADTEIYFHAASRIWVLDEFFQPEFAKWTLEALDRGLLRARQLSEGTHPWTGNEAVGFPIVRAYRSKIDASLQPYAVTFPANYFKDLTRRWRLDVVLHGRDTTLNEVKFLHRFNGNTAAPADQSFVRLDIFGRGNNAYRWAGEIDVYEAIDHFLFCEGSLNRLRLIDKDRVVLRGFSMGGAGTWHLGLHRPDNWCVLGPGAGFTTTHGYIKGLPAKLPPYQEACLRIYDAVDYAENAFDVPVVAYSGAEDPQKQAADNMELRCKKLGIPMTHLIAPGLKHKFPPEWQKKADALYAKYTDKGKDEYPSKIRFVTYTMRYPSAYWLEILGLQKHFERAAVEAERTDSGFALKTTNVRGLRLALQGGSADPLTVKIDGAEVSARPWLVPGGAHNIYLERRHGLWKSVLPQLIAARHTQVRQKLPGLQGPIDDAFMDGFLCVRGTGTAWHKATAKYAEGNLHRFQHEWAKFWRGQLPIKDDKDVTNEDIATKHLILFGDPASNSVLAQVIDDLPFSWNKEQIGLNDKTYTAGEHVPVMIYPNPLNPKRYVVLNSGHTFHERDYLGTNALLYPRLGDYAVLRLAPSDRDALGVEVATAGLFDDYWNLPKQGQ